MKQFACWFTHGVGNGSELRRIVHAAHTPAEVLESVEGFFVDRFTVAKNEGRSAVVARLTGAQEEADPVGVARNEDPAMVPQVSTPVARQRTERRIAVRLPLRVRGRDKRGVIFEEETSSENLCRSGAAFMTRFDVAIGSISRFAFRCAIRFAARGSGLHHAGAASFTCVIRSGTARN